MTARYGSGIVTNMPRLNKDLTKVRDDLIRSLVLTNPKISYVDINDALKAATGRRMASYRIKRLKETAIEEIAKKGPTP